jgi:hypothetical protein
MKPARTAGRLIRIAMATVFGFMNLGHGPIMTFAHTAKHETAAVVAPVHHHAAAHQHHDPGPEHHIPAAVADQPLACNAFGCFITVGAIVVQAPSQELMPIGKLLPPPSRASLPADSEPADPPPRLHA